MSSCKAVIASAHMSLLSMHARWPSQKWRSLSLSARLFRKHFSLYKNTDKKEIRSWHWISGTEAHGVKFSRWCLARLDVQPWHGCARNEVSGVPHPAMPRKNLSSNCRSYRSPRVCTGNCFSCNLFFGACSEAFPASQSSIARCDPVNSTCVRVSRANCLTYRSERR